MADEPYIVLEATFRGSNQLFSIIRTSLYSLPCNICHIVFPTISSPNISPLPMKWRAQACKPSKNE